MENGDRVFVETSTGRVYGTVIMRADKYGEIVVRWDDAEHDGDVHRLSPSRVHVDFDDPPDVTIARPEDFSYTPEHHEAMAERAIDAALEDDQPLGWDRMDAVARCCAILEKLPRQEWWPAIRLINKWAGLVREAAE